MAKLKNHIEVMKIIMHICGNEIPRLIFFEGSSIPKKKKKCIDIYQMEKKLKHFQNIGISDKAYI